MPIATLVGRHSPIRKGDTGPGVERIQHAVRQLGLAMNDNPSVFGPDTEAAIMMLQHAGGLEPDGVLDHETAVLMDHMLQFVVSSVVKDERLWTANQSLKRRTS